MNASTISGTPLKLGIQLTLPPPNCPTAKSGNKRDECATTPAEALRLIGGDPSPLLFGEMGEEQIQLVM
jgi:hypothetical protein